MSHTPGPWHYENEDGDRYIRSQDGTSLMCDMQCYPWAPQNKDDWNLIAAAPELLAALKDIMENGGPNQERKSCGHRYNCICPEKAAIAAIKKAEGK